MPLLSRLTTVGAAREAVQGTPVLTPTFWLPLSTFKPEDLIEEVKDDSFFGNPTLVRGIYAGVKDATVDFDGPAYPDIVGNLFVAMGLYDATTGTAGSKSGTLNGATAVGATSCSYTLVGGAAPVATDVVQIDTGVNAELRTLTSVTGAGPYTLNWAATAPLQYAHANTVAIVNTTGTNYTHSFKLNNNQPPSYTFMHYDVYESRAWPGCVADSLDFKIDTKGMVTYQTKWKGWPSSPQSNAVAAFGSTTPFLPWNGSTTFAGGADANLLSGNISIKRSVEAIHTINGTQNPNVVWAGPFEASGKLDFVFTSNTEIAVFRNYVQSNPLSLALSQAGGPVLTFTFNKPGAVKAMTDSSKSFYTVSVDIEGIYNTTDGGSFSATLLNSVVNNY